MRRSSSAPEGLRGFSEPRLLPGRARRRCWKCGYQPRHTSAVSGFRPPFAARRPGPGRARDGRLGSATLAAVDVGPGTILGWSVLLLAAALAASTAVTHLLLVRQLDTRVQAELSHEVAEFRMLAARPAEGSGGPGSVVALLRARTSQAVLENDVTLIGLAGGKVAAASNNPAAAFLRHDPALLARWTAVTRITSGTAQLATGQARYIAIPVRAAGDPARGVFVATVLTSADLATINGVARLQLEVGVAALLLGAGLAWLVAGRVLRPVRETTNLARRITEADLAGRIPLRGRNEISELALTFNHMLDRLEAALTAQRRFLADAGHELRTPITIIQGNLDTLEPRTADDAETLVIAADELTRMSRLVDELHLLAHSERADFLNPGPVDLAELTRSLAAKARSLDDRPWVLTGAAQGVAVLDAQRITQAVMQLAANAVAHTPPAPPSNSARRSPRESSNSWSPTTGRASRPPSANGSSTASPAWTRAAPTAPGWACPSWRRSPPRRAARSA